MRGYLAECAADARSNNVFPGLHRSSPRQITRLLTPVFIACFVNAPFASLGTDGFGRSDTRTALRRFFEVDRHQVVLAALRSLVNIGALGPDTLAAAIDRYGIDAEVRPPWSR